MHELDKANIEDVTALTPVQEGLLFDYLKEPGNDVYVEQLHLELKGTIDVYRFRETWDILTQTNEVLRSAFRWENRETPVRMVFKKHHLHFDYYDFSDKEAELRGKILEEISAEDLDMGFDLRDVPFRVVLSMNGANEYLMIISHHNILYDGWSSGIILGEFFKTYDDLSNEKTPPIPGKTKFKTFTRWFDTRDTGAEKEFWKNQFTGFEHQPGLLIKKKGTRKKEIEEEEKEPGKNIKRVGFGLEPVMVKQLEQLVKEHKLTLATVFYAAWGLVLRGCVNSNDIVFGTAVSGRSAGISEINGIGEMVGLFGNTPPLRVTSAPDGNITDLLCGIDDALELREPFEHTSLGNVKEYLGVKSNEKLFDTIVVIEHYPLESRLIKGGHLLTVDSHHIMEKTHYDLTVEVRVFNGIRVDFTYDETLFDESLVSRLKEHFKRVLEGIVNAPDGEIINLI
ncbi:MAG: hypothetical protein GY940_46075 [bacterium]|nr:hypothetical protein [bacterium]